MRSFKGDLVIPNSEITLQTGLNERRFMHLKKTVNQAELVTVISLQIQDLLDFLGMEMTSKQIVDTSEFILQKHDFLSIRGVQHCFNMVKSAEPPFNKPLYNSVTGRKILDWLREYDKLVDEYLFADAEKKVYLDGFRKLDKKINKTQQGLIGLADAMGTIRENLKGKTINNKKNS